jgi:hypothetical protein
MEVAAVVAYSQMDQAAMAASAVAAMEREME